MSQSSHFFNTSRDSDSTTSLDSPFQCSKTLSKKKFLLMSGCSSAQACRPWPFTELHTDVPYSSHELRESFTQCNTFGSLQVWAPAPSSAHSTRCYCAPAEKPCSSGQFCTNVTSEDLWFFSSAVPWIPAAALQDSHLLSSISMQDALKVRSFFVYLKCKH